MANRIFIDFSKEIKKATEALKQYSAGANSAANSTKKVDDANNKAKRGFLGLQKGLRNVHNEFSVLRSKMLLGAFAIGLVEKSVVRLTKAFGEQEDAETRVNQAIVSTGRLAQISGQQLQQYASDLQKVTKFGDEVILSSSALLLTFTKIGSDVFPQAQKAVLDLASAMGTDLKSASVQVGKALNDPLKGLTALQRVGIVFTQSQREQIKVFMANNEVAKAQAIILKELNVEFGGMADILAQTVNGQLAQANNAFGDMAENIGQNLAPVVLSVAKALKELSEEANQESTKKFVQTILFLAQAFLTLKVASGAALVVTKNFNKVIKGLGRIAFGLTGTMSNLFLMNKVNTVQIQKLTDGLDLATISMSHFDQAAKLKLAQEGIEGSKKLIKELRKEAQESAIADIALETGQNYEFVKHQIETLTNNEFKTWLKQLRVGKTATQMLSDGTLSLIERYKRLEEITKNVGNMTVAESEALIKMRKAYEKLEVGSRIQDIKNLTDQTGFMTNEQFKLLEMQEKERLSLQTLGISYDKITEIQLQNMIDKTAELSIEKQKGIQQSRLDIQETQMNNQVILDLETTLVMGLTDLWNSYSRSRMKDINAEYDLKVQNAKKTIKNERLLDIELDKIASQKEQAEKQAHNKLINMQILSTIAEGAAAAFKIYANMAPGMANPWTTSVYTPLFYKQMGVLAIQKALAIGSLQAQKAEYGADFVTQGPQMLMVGDNPGGRERVQVTPIGSPNVNGPSGGNVNITFTGNVMTQSFIEDEAIPAIKEAVRRGADIGIS